MNACVIELVPSGLMLYRGDEDNIKGSGYTRMMFDIVVMILMRKKSRSREKIEDKASLVSCMNYYISENNNSYTPLPDGIHWRIVAHWPSHILFLSGRSTMALRIGKKR